MISVLVTCWDCERKLTWDYQQDGYADSNGATACFGFDDPDGPFSHEPYILSGLLGREPISRHEPI